MAHPAALPDAQLLAQVTVRTSRAGGPGGQRRNKVQTAVQLVHQPTGLAVVAAERRSLQQNRVRALARLRLELALHHREPLQREDVQPSELWRRRMGGPRLALARTHADLPALLAEALDVLAARDDDPAAAAAALGVTTSRLLRLLKRVPKALAELNARRAAAGRRAWR